MAWNQKEWYERVGRQKAKEKYLANKEKALEYGRKYRSDPEKKKRMQFSVLQNRAKKAGIPCTIKFEELVWPEVCPILGIELKYGGSSWDSPSMDKVIPELGYITGNVKIISNLANTMKSHATKEQCLAFAKNIESYFDS